MRIKRILILSSAILCMLTTIQGRTIRDFFASEPGRIFTLLPSNTRLDLLDYFDSGKIVWAQNNLGNGTSLSAVDSTSITVVTSESKTVQLRLLTQGSKDSVIAVIETVRTPVPDSRITFYNTRWERLPDGKKFKKPSLSDFFLSRVSKSHLSGTGVHRRWPLGGSSTPQGISFQRGFCPIPSPCGGLLGICGERNPHKTLQTLTRYGRVKFVLQSPRQCPDTC